MKDIKSETGETITWCRGCGNFAILNAFKNTVSELEEEGIPKRNIFITSGIGCHGKISDYVEVSGVYSLHGRDIATAQGMKLANPDLKIIDFAGDGDCYGEGIAHMIFAAKRNIDITVFVYNNGAYALTTGQYSPTSPKGFKGPSTPGGSIEEPFNPLSLVLEAGASFAARGYAGNPKHLTNLMKQAIMHKGFAFVDVLQPSVVFNDKFKEYNELTEEIETPAKNRPAAMKLAKKLADSIPIGLIYKEERAVFESELMGEHIPAIDRVSGDKRLKMIKSFVDNT